MTDFYICPTCGNEVPVGKSGCAICRKKSTKKKPLRKKKAAWKAPARSWEQDESYDGLDLPSDNFDYDEFCAKEFGTAPPHRQIGIKYVWWLTALLLVALFIYFAGKEFLFLW
ncbi:hypothetical protein NT6N_11060 [Oceaniferula spumae]|uniref:Zinc ribbon domain-containing protein n=1 Tax=Oceaniferula spumae TaxID=2979115 RepID=A0AAT9FJ22_9BACT